jgi:hypothetical protein
VLEKGRGAIRRGHARVVLLDFNTHTFEGKKKERGARKTGFYMLETNTETNKEKQANKQRNKQTSKASKQSK